MTTMIMKVTTTTTNAIESTHKMTKITRARMTAIMHSTHGCWGQGWKGGEDWGNRMRDIIGAYPPHLHHCCHLQRWHRMMCHITYVHGCCRHCSHHCNTISLPWPWPHHHNYLPAFAVAMSPPPPPCPYYSHHITTTISLPHHHHYHQHLPAFAMVTSPPLPPSRWSCHYHQHTSWD